MPKLLIIGGTGFFGKALLRHYSNLSPVPDLSIYILSRNPKVFLATNPIYASLPFVQFLQGDIEDYSTLPADHSFTHLIHAASDSTRGSSLTPLETYRQIYAGTRNVLQLAAITGVKRFLYCSSGAVYGPQPDSLPFLSETHPSTLPFDQFHSYGHAKRAAEYLCHLHAAEDGFDLLIARCFSFSGPDLPLNAHYAFGNFLHDALTSPNIVVNSSGESIRSYLDQADLAVWLTRILFDAQPGSIFNVGSDIPLSVLDLAKAVRDVISPHKQIQIVGQPNSGGSRLRYVPSILKAKRQLGLDVTISLQDSLLRCLGSLL